MLLVAASLAVAPASASADPTTSKPETRTWHYEWSTGKGRLGVQIMTLTPELRAHFGAAQDRGVLVAHVEPGTPAASAGLQVGDVITDVKGERIDSARDVISALSAVKKQQKVGLDVIRDRKPLALEATLQDDPAPAPAADAFPFGDEMPWFRDWMRRFDQSGGPWRPTSTT